jgi:Protein kinase domain
MESQSTLLKDRYSVVRLLGRGGMGEVFLAEDKLLLRQVAVKKVVYNDNEFLLKSAEKEAMVLARLQHQCLPKVLDYFNEDNAQYIVMEYIGGKDLGEMLQRNKAPFSTEQVWAWVDTLLEILKYLHGQATPVVHRDIKPQNIKITDEGKLFLIDFGLVKDTPTRVKGESLSLSVYGYSQSYAPLEQINGDPTSVQTDIYGLCATLYHLLTNVRPADALNRAAKKISNKTDPLRPAHEVNPNIPLGLSQILEAGLKLSCDERIKSAQALRQLFNQAKNKRERIHINVDATDDKKSAGEPAPVPAKSGFMGDKRKSYALIAGALIVLILTAWICYGWRQQVTRERAAQEQFNDAQSLERAEGLLSQRACAGYDGIKADDLVPSMRSLLGRKLDDCKNVRSLFQKADKAEKDKGLNYETAASYKEVVEQYPDSASAKQADKKVGEYERVKQATERAWKEMQKADTEIRDSNYEGYARYEKIVVLYDSIALENVDPLLAELIENWMAVNKETMELLDKQRQEANAYLEKVKKKIEEYKERYGDSWDAYFRIWFQQVGQPEANKIDENQKKQRQQLQVRARGIAQSDEYVGSRMREKFNSKVFKDRFK